MTVVDSDVWIFLNLDDAPEHQAARNKIEKLRAEGLHINEIIVSEVFHKLSMYLGSREARGRVSHILESAFVIYETTGIDSLNRALTLAVQHRMRINDAIIAVQAVEARKPLLTDNVKDFKKVPRLAVIPLRHVRT